MLACDHILRFQPIFRRYLWGGRRLATVLGKPIGPEPDYAESWELVDHGADQSIVRFGPLAGTTLHDLVQQYGAELFGSELSDSAGDQAGSFPLLMKLLDCNRTLSVQVHPNDEQAARLTPPDLGKTEAWVVLAAESGSKIYAGLKPGVTREALAAALAAGRCETTLHEFEPRVGDCVFIPAGTIHALGAGLLIAEIQQASDTTFRLFDWNRVDAEGKPRALHIEQSLDTIDYARGPVGPQMPDRIAADRERLVACDKFVLDRVMFNAPATLGGDNRFHIVCVAEGSARAACDPADLPLARGDVALLPAAAGAVEFVPYGKTVLLDIRLPRRTPAGNPTMNRR